MHDAPARLRPPVPTSVSEQAQAYLASTIREDEPMPALDDVAGWEDYVRATDQRVVAQFAAFQSPIEASEIDVEGVRTYVAATDDVDADTAPIFLDIHGGALIMCGGDLCRSLAEVNALWTGMLVWAPDYRMAPHHPYPAALDDCVAVYRAALEQRAPEDLFVGGMSAGGNLAAALLLRAKDEGLPMPAALVLGSPEVDLTESGDSFRTNLDVDAILGPLMPVNLLYAAGHDLTHPYLSPLFGDLGGFPPTFLQTGTRDLFLSNTVRMHRALRAAGVDADLHVYEAMPHAGFGGTAPEDFDVRIEMRQFLDKHRRPAG